MSQLALVIAYLAGLALALFSLQDLPLPAIPPPRHLCPVRGGRGSTQVTWTQ